MSYLYIISDTITIDSDAEEAQKSLSIDSLSTSDILCDCNSVNCDICINASDRRRIINIFRSMPIIVLDNNKAIVTQMAKHLQLSHRLIHKVINKFRNMLYASRANAPIDLPSFHQLTMLDLCTLRREMLAARPAQINRAFKLCCASFKHKMKSDGLFDGLSVFGLWWQCIRHRVKKTRRLIVFEHEYIRVQRIRFIRAIQRHRREGKQIIYINEVNPLVPNETMTRTANALIIAAASADGPIASVYMKKLTTRNFLKWMTTHIFNKLTEPSIIVMRSSSIFRSHPVMPLPEENDSREQMLAWLQAHNVAYNANMYKNELFELIMGHEEGHHNYMIDVKIRERGHDIYYIPLYNADLDPFELIWYTIRLKMMAKGVRSFNMNKEFMQIERDVWAENFQRIVDMENKYIDIERNFDRTNTLYRIEHPRTDPDDHYQIMNCIS